MNTRAKVSIQGKPPSVLGFLNHEITGILGQIILPWEGACPGHYRACDMAMSLTRHTTCDNQYCLHMLPSAPWEQNHHIDDHWRTKDTFKKNHKTDYISKYML